MLSVTDRYQCLCINTHTHTPEAIATSHANTQAEGSVQLWKSGKGIFQAPPSSTSSLSGNNPNWGKAVLQKKKRNKDE